MSYLLDRQVGPKINRPPIPRLDPYLVDDKKVKGLSPLGGQTAFLDGRILQQVITGNIRDYHFALIAADAIFDINLPIGRALYLKDIQCIATAIFFFNVRVQWQIWADGSFKKGGHILGSQIDAKIYLPPLTNIRFYTHFVNTSGFNSGFTVSFEWIEFSSDLDKWDWGHGSSIQNPGIGDPRVVWP